MLIFDKFERGQNAYAFAVHVRDKWGRASRVCEAQEESNQYDPFPFALQPPIVLVERDSDGGPQREPEIESAVKQFGGAFAGT